MRLSICYKLIRGDPAVSARFSLRIPRLSRSQASINSNRLRVGGIPLTLSLIESKADPVIVRPSSSVLPIA